LTLSAYDRLYYSGLQRKASKERKTEILKQSRADEELSQLQKGPKISIISSEVAKNLTKRPKNQGSDFLEYSIEWSRLRDAKI
jgi:hypothetical protein